jgi:hypothetical protein
MSARKAVAQRRRFGEVENRRMGRRAMRDPQRVEALQQFFGRQWWTCHDHTCRRPRQQVLDADVANLPRTAIMTLIAATAAMERGRSSGVEHNLAKVGVEGSNPFARSKLYQDKRRRRGLGAAADVEGGPIKKGTSASSQTTRVCYSSGRAVLCGPTSTAARETACGVELGDQCVEGGKRQLQPGPKTLRAPPLEVV